MAPLIRESPTASAQAAIVLVCNGPGELATWVRPLASRLHRELALRPLDPAARLALLLVLVPCPNATGGEHRVAERMGLFERIVPARRFWWLLLRPRRHGPWPRQGVVVFLGGDQFWTVLLSARLGVDISRYSLDGPIPDLSLPDTSHGFAKAMLSKARRDNMTLRDLYNLTAAARGHWVLCGSAKTIADTLEKWFLEYAADGFNVMPAYFPGAFDDFVDEVVPELQGRGLYRKAYSGVMLRDHLGLDRPERRP